MEREPISAPGLIDILPAKPDETAVLLDEHHLLGKGFIPGGVASTS
jgi:hypothetical protein